MRRVALLACCAVLCVLIVADQASAQTPPEAPEAPATPTTTPRTNRISVNWTAPAGTGITAYDVRYIRADAPDKADANWTLVDPAWTGTGALTYRMDDLRDETRYEIQVRAVNSGGDGAWSSSATAAPNDPGRSGNRGIRTADLRVPKSIKGFLSSPTDADTYRTSEASGSGSTFIYTTGPLHADGDLFSRAGRQLRVAGTPIMSIDGVRGVGLTYMGTGLQHHFEVSSLNDRHSDEYSVHSVKVINPASSTTAAPEIPLGTVTRGRIHPSGGTAGDQDYFKFVLAASTTIWAAAFGDFTSGVEHFDTYMDVLDSAGTNVLATSNDTYLPVGPNSSSIVKTLDAGTYFLRIRGDTDSDTGYYTLDFRSAQLPGSTSAGAIPLRFHGLAAGDLSSTTDTDFFRITNYREEFWQIALVSPTAGITFAATLSTADGTTRSIHVSQESPSAGSAATLRATLQPGVYSLQVSSSDSTAPGQYLVLPTYDARMRATLADCGPGAGSVRTDSLYDCLWHLEDLGLYPNSNNVDINVEGVWATNKGAGIVVAIVDDGVDPNHEDLHENVDDTMTHAYGTADDYSLDATHGTALAGIVAARDNEIGVRGVAPRATIYSYNLFLDPSASTSTNLADAMFRNGANVAVSNNSFGANPGTITRAPDSWVRAVERGVNEGYTYMKDGKEVARGTVYVWAAGNDSLPGYDASNLDPYVNHYTGITVSAVAYNGFAPLYSETGVNVWVAAPSGGDPASPGLTAPVPGNRYSRAFSGTSASAAVVSGVVALVRAANADLTWRDVKLILAATSFRSSRGGFTRGALQYGSTTARYSFNDSLGFGVVDAGAAVALAQTWTNLPAFRDIEVESATLDAAIAAPSGNDQKGAVTEVTLTLDPYVGFVEFMEIDITLEHPSIRDLEIELVSPSGVVSRLSRRLQARHSRVATGFPSAIDGPYRFGSSKHLGENAAGVWTLRISDYLQAHTGTLKSWKLKAYGHGSKPGYATVDSATAGARQLTIGWTAPTDGGGSAVTSYDLRYVRSSAAATATPTVVTAIGTDDTGTYNLTGLQPAEYDIQVRAVNTTGAGPWSEVLKGTPTKEKPFAPSIDTVTSRNTELAVAWSAPTVDGGSEITSYGVHHILTSEDGTVDANWTPNNTAWITGGGDLEYTITGLTNAVSYDVRVSATNAIGTSDWSAVKTGTPDVLNHDPMFADATAERSVAENTVAGRNIGSRVAATDSDGDTLTYTLASGDATFDINATTGQLLTEAALNYETTTSYTVIIGVSDGKDSNDEADMVEDDSIIVTVNVTDVDEPPEISGDEMITVAENHDATLDTYTADDPEGETTPTITWALAGVDEGDFAITAGALSFDPPPDFDIPADLGTNNIYNVTVQALQGTKTGSLAVTVTVTPVNERPTITSGPVTVGYPENRTNLRVGTYAATDPDAGDTVTWSLEGMDDGDFEITTSGAVTFKDQPNYEAKEAYAITVKAADPEGLSGTRDVAITVEDFDEPPEISGDDMITVEENHDATLDTYAARDPEGDTTTPITWALAGADAGDFEISDMGALSFDPPPDYDIPADAAPSDNVYLVTVQARQGSKTGSLEVTVTVTGVNEKPTITSGPETVGYPENRTNLQVGTYAATDPDAGDTVTWSLEGNDRAAFAITTSGAVTFKDQPNYEDEDEYAITVKATDGGGLSGTRDVAITVEDFDEPPVISGDKTITVEENHSGTLDTYMATDPEGATTITWSTGGTDGDDFTISATGDLSFKSSPDFEDPLDSSLPYNEYLVTVRASDGAETGTYEVTVTVTDDDEPPKVEGPASVMDFPENSPATMVVASYTATDPEGSAGLIWSTLSGTDAVKFVLDSDGDLRFKTSPNFELQSKYEVTVNASDGGTELGSLDVTVTLEDVNEPPTIMGPIRVDFTENGTGTVAMYSAVDPDAGATQAWSLLGADRGDFEISDTGDLRFKSPPDYDMPTDVGGDRGDNVYLVTVQVYDGFNRVTRDVVVRVEDVNEAPTVSGSLTPSVAENSTGTIETYTADDPEGAAITWSVEGAGADDFTITSDAGALSFAVASPPNYEAQTSHTVTVRASDEEHDVDTDVTVTVTDVNEVEEITLSARRPLIGADYTAAFTEGKGDAVQSPTWVWARSTSLDSGYEDIVPAATAATYRPLAADRDYYLRVTASYNDGHGTTTKTLVATSEFVTAPNSLNNMAPVFPSPLFTGGVTGLSVLENATAETVVGVAPEATDDQGSTLSYSLEVSGFTTDPPFEINATTRQIRVASGAILNHEDQDSYSVTVTAVDEFNLTATATFEITVGDVNEAPTAVPDTPSTPEGDAVTFDVLANDTDPDDGDTLTAAIATRPAANLGSVSLDPDTYEVTYTPPDADFNGPVTFTYTASDGEFDDDASVTITVDPVNDPPTFSAATAARSISERAQPGVLVGAAVTAEDVDGDVLEYSLSGASGFFVIDAETGQISVGPTPDFELETYNATVTATDEEGEIATIAVPITVTDVNDAPTAGNDTASVDEDKSVTIDVLANDSDPEGVALRVSVATQPANGLATVDSDETSSEYNHITYTPNANFHGTDPFTYTASDGEIGSDARVTVTVRSINDTPTFPADTAERSVLLTAAEGDPVGNPVEATDADEDDTLTYSLSGADASSFEIDAEGQITVSSSAILDPATPLTVTVIARDSATPPGTAMVEVTITVRARPVRPPIIITGPVAPRGPTPSAEDFEWNVARDIEELDGGNDWPTGLWSDGATLWLAENGPGADDEVYAYDLASGERVEGREFELDATNRAPRGFWSDGVTAWVSDSGRDRLFAYDLESGERDEDHEVELPRDNRDPRGIWSDGVNIWVLDGRADALLAYDLASGERLTGYELASANSDPRGIWSDGVTVWVSDDGAKRLFAYRLPVPRQEEQAADADAVPLVRVRDEESRRSRASPTTARAASGRTAR